MPDPNPNLTSRLNIEIKEVFKKFPEALEFAIDNLPQNDFVIQQVLEVSELVLIYNCHLNDTK